MTSIGYCSTVHCQQHVHEHLWSQVNWQLPVLEIKVPMFNTTLYIVLIWFAEHCFSRTLILSRR